MKAKEEAQMGHLDKAELAGGPVTDGARRAGNWRSLHSAKARSATGLRGL